MTRYSSGTEPLETGRASAATGWSPLSRFIALDSAIAARCSRSAFTTFIYEFVRFGLKQAWACLFGASMLGLILATHAFYPRNAALARYDFLTIAAVVIQLAMLRFKLETFEEAKVIFVFHLVGTAMEVFKTGVGSWLYPEPSVLHIMGVPLFTGFMYASIGSYIARAWRLFDFHFVRHPPLWAISTLSAAIYANFFAHHFVVDVRAFLFAATVLLFGRTWVFYRIHNAYRRMPLLLGLALVAGFIWIAENLGTFASAWVYPAQRAVWTVVPFTKFGAWYLLMIVSYTLVAWVNGVRDAAIVEGEVASQPAAALTPNSIP